MDNYLLNNICKFTPLFDIDFNKKQNIFSAIFFKLHGGSYKNFEMYMKGLNNLTNFIRNSFKGYKLRLFIDESIFEDKYILEKLKSYNIIQLVKYHCTEFVIDDKYHRGLFGTLIRFFPMFDFPNNDAGIVRVTDIDFFYKNHADDQFNLNKIIKKLESSDYYNQISLILHSRIYHVGIRGNFIYKDYIVPYTTADKIVSLKRMDHKIISDFLGNIDDNKEFLSLYPKIDVLAKSKDKQFVFGVDEYFLNNILVYKLVIDRVPITFRFKFGIMYPFYWSLEVYDEFTKKQKEFLENSVNFILKDELKIKSKTYKEKINILDEYLYNLENRDLDKKTTKNIINISKRIIKIFEKIRDETLYFYPFTESAIIYTIDNPSHIEKTVIHSHVKKSELLYTKLIYYDNEKIFIFNE
tara:strand:- start:1086 stop:2318 length:1233 start_codon:yes stop_codon:yes gene_type:complete